MKLVAATIFIASLTMVVLSSFALGLLFYRRCASFDMDQSP
jgi:hypothetical protein